MIRRLFASLLLAGAACLPALAGPVLLPEVTIDADIVTVGDMFADAGVFAEQPLFRAPAPGTAGLVNISAVDAAAERIGFVGYSTDGLTAVRVARTGHAVTESDIVSVIEADLAAKGIVGADMSIDVRFSTRVPQLTAATASAPLQLASLRYLPGNGTFSARLLVAGLSEPVELQGTLEVMIEVPHLAASLPAGTILRAADLRMQPVALRYAQSAGYAQARELVGMALVRQSREGLMLKSTDVGVPQMIGRNDAVTVYYRSGKMTLTVRGQALTAGAEGDPIQVLNLMSRRVLNAVVIGPGAVELSPANLSVANL